MEGEVWKPIKGYEDLYEVSNHGRLRTLRKCLKLNGYCFPTIIMKLQMNHQQYHTIHLRRPGMKQKKFFVHRIVASHFLDQVEGKEYVNHKDKLRTHNHVSNLEYCTHKENCDHRDGNTITTNEDW